VRGGSLVAKPADLVRGAAVRARTRGWAPRTRLLAVGERTGWSVDEDARELEATARRLGYEVGPAAWALFSRRQAVFLTSHFDALLGPHWLRSSHRLATAYLHGRPGTPGAPEFDAAYDALARDPGRLSAVQVTHDEMHDLVLEAGVAPERVFAIPIGVDIASFPLGDAEKKGAARRALGLPEAAFVVGSFQKDGVGWDEGLEPKLVKGPDLLVAALERVRGAVPELHVLLTGPARGYVRRELERLGTPFVHTVAADRGELARAYHALDAYVVPSRQEGGPKGVLEAMATGVPLVTTRVGQAQEIVEDGLNGLLVEVEDAEALADALVRIHADTLLRGSFAIEGRATAERFAHERLDPAWEALLEGLVVREGA
jgi:glycosyltransferase involved in cell wall biosynthesis